MILTLNTGSSSVRLDVFDEAGGPPKRLSSRRLEGASATEHEAALREAAAGARLVAHRVVHGGTGFAAAARIDARVEAGIEALVPLAPLHNTVALEWIRAARACAPKGAVHVAVFDTSFFRALPEAASTYAIPRDLAERHGLRRLGFHGLAHRSMWNQWAAANPRLAGRGRAITFQLGSGCSVAAIEGGRPRDTSMGFTPLEGLVMATRAGDLDPGLLLHLQQSGMDPVELGRILSRESGLQGLAGDSDLRRLLARDDAQARLAVEVYCHRARRYLGAFLAILGGAEAILFGGGVGENQPEIRARILSGLGFAGIELDEPANLRGEGRIGAAGSRVELRVMAVDEAAVMAEEALAAV